PRAPGCGPGRPGPGAAASSSSRGLRLLGAHDPQPGLQPGAHDVELDGDDDGGPERDVLPAALDVHEVEAVLDDAEDERADEGADHGAAATEEARPADDDGGDGGELQEVAGRGVGGVRLAGDDDGRRAGAHAAEDVDGDEHPVHGHADAPGGLAVAADGVDPLPPGDPPQEHVDDDGEDGDEDHGPRHPPEVAVPDG